MCVLIKVLSSSSKAPKEKYNPLTEIDYNLDLEDEYSIKGINKSGINDRYLGDFEGAAVAFRDNPYDPYAVGIYINNKRIGWLPAGSVGAHVAIMAAGGTVKAHGYIAKAKEDDDEDGDEFYYGKVRLEV
jgi:hypothetical protein